MKIAVLAIAAVCLASPAAASSFASETSRKSKQHPRVILAPRKSGATATIRIQFRAGAFDDRHRSGLTRLTQHALIAANAVESHEELAVDLFAAGADIQLETGVRESALSLTAPASQFMPLAKRLAAMVLAPRIEANALEAAKSRALQQQDNATIAVLATLLARTTFTEAGYSNDPAGDKETIRALTAADVREHLREAMSPANATVIVTGRFDARSMRTFLGKFRGGRTRDRVRPRGELAGSYHQKSAFEVHVVAYPIVLDSPQAIAAAHVLGAIVEERVQREFRRMGIAYSTLAAPFHRDWLDSLIIVLPIHSDGGVSAGARLAAEIDAIRKGELIRDELERNRAHVLRTFERIDLDSKLLAEALGVGAGELEWFSPRIAATISKMSKEDLLATAARWLQPAASIHVQLSPRARGR